MEFRHTPVLAEESIKNLSIKKDGIYIDGTAGGGGHSRLIAERLSEHGRLVAIDRDADAVEAARERLKGMCCRVDFVHGNYAQIKDILEELQISSIDGALLDLGVSSFQLDNAERGFSYMHDAPLDMRMNRDEEFSAADVVNNYSENELYEVIKKYGEERWAKRIAKFIVKSRTEARISTTGQLVEIIKKAVPAGARRDGHHPAKRTFQAIRIEVNDELKGVERATKDFIDVLNMNGRLCVITFHSLEDRIVKNIFKERANPCTCPSEFPVCVCGKKADVRIITKKPVVPSIEEVNDNPRARSAKLRCLEKTAE